MVNKYLNVRINHICTNRVSSLHAIEIRPNNANPTLLESLPRRF